jgi:hypothetical protein
MSVLWAVGIFFSPSSAVRALFFSSYLKERGTSFSPSSVRHVEKIEHFQARKRTNFFFSTRKRHETRPFSLSLSCSSSLKIALSHNRYRLLDRAGDHPMRRSFALFERQRSSSSRSTTTREFRERKRGKKKKHSETTRETKGSKNSHESDTFSSLSWNFSKRLNENVPRA